MSSRLPKSYTRLLGVALAALTAIVVPLAPAAPKTSPAPSGLTVTAASQTTVSLAWNAGPTSTIYRVYRDGTQVGSTSAATYAVQGLSCGKTYELGVDFRRSERASVSAATAACPAPSPPAAPADTQPPSVPQNQRITGTTTSTIAMAWSAATDNVAVTGYDVYLDGTLAGSTSQTSYTYSGLGCGRTYTVGLEARDAAGNRSNRAYASGPASTQACASADTTPPTSPSSLVTTGTTQTSVSLSWNASTDNVGVAGYGRYRDGILVTSGPGTTQTHSGLTCGTSYAFAVDAYDAAGNRSNRATTSATTAACSTSTPPPPAPTPGAPTTANFWVDTNGGSCARQATRGSYSDTQACSWNQAYQGAQTGDLILVKGGSYGDVSIGPNRTAIAAPGVTFQTASGETVTVGDFENGNIAGGTGGSNVTFVGPVTARTFRSDRASNVVVDGWRVDCNGCVGVQIFHIESASNVTVRNSDISDNTDNSLIWISGSNLTFENNVIHDAGLRAGSGAHTECMYVWNVTNLTLKRNHFYRCAVMDVFITGGAVSSGGYVENNVFEKPWSTTGQISNSAYAFHFRNGGDPSPDPSNWDFRYNTFVGPLSISSENPVGSGGMRVIGNAFLSGTPCGKSNTTYANNAFVSGGCGTGAIVNPLSTYQAGFTNTGDPGTYSLRSTSVLRDKGGSSYPAMDRAGTARPNGAAADIGAYEYAG